MLEPQGRIFLHQGWVESSMRPGGVLNKYGVFQSTRGPVAKNLCRWPSTHTEAT